VALRRRRPLLAFGWAAAAATLVTLLVPAVSALYFYLPAAYLLYLVAAVSRRKVALAALATLLVLVVIAAVRMTPVVHVPGVLAPPVLIVIIAWTFGYTAGQRRAYAEHLRTQAATSAVTEERLRIARELHDVVAHSMTVIAVQAGYGRHVIDAQPDKAGEALGAIQATSREALTDMRGMLGVLRRPGSEPFGKKNEPRGRGGDRPAGIAVPAGNGGLAAGARGADGGKASGAANGVAREAAPLAPAPGLADLDRLVERIGHAGVLVDLRVRGSRRELPPGIDLSAFRIVQEALTNVVKHADTPCCRVTVSYGEDELFVEITDEGRGGQVPAAAGGHGPGAEAGAGGAGRAELAGGHGLIGMRERVSLYGGELTAAPLPRRGFRVAARLPVGDGGS
jgi:signal transduction histidine kinase